MVKCRNWIAQYLKVFGTGLELILTDVVPNNVRLKLYIMMTTWMVQFTGDK